MKNLLSGLMIMLVTLLGGAKSSAQELFLNGEDQVSEVALVSSELSDEELEDLALMQEESYEAPAGKLFDEEAFYQGATPFSQFTNVIVVNKAAKGPGAQTLRLYSNGRLILKTAVSTGTEDVERIGFFEGIFHSLFKGATSSHWRHTTRGFYTIKRVEGYNYRSGESNFQMPYAMFFNSDRGLAVHQVPPDLASGEAAGEKALGRRASSGCIRVHKSQISMIHWVVNSAGKGTVPVIDSKTGLQVYDRNGNPRYEVGYKSIVIVEEN